MHGTTDRIGPGGTTGERRPTAVLLIGFQNELFEPGGVLGTISDGGAPQRVLDATVRLLARLVESDVAIIAAPIAFTPSYDELIHPVGVLAEIKESSALQPGTHGASRVADIDAFASRILEVPGHRGLNAFSNPALHDLLTGLGIVDVVLAGAITCLNVDATGRSALELGYRVSVLSDCLLGRTRSETELFCQRVFPLYARVLTSSELVEQILGPAPSGP